MRFVKRNCIFLTEAWLSRMIGNAAVGRKEARKCNRKLFEIKCRRLLNMCQILTSRSHDPKEKF